MRRAFKKFFGLILSTAIFFSSFSTGMISVKAEGEHQFSIQAYDWNAFDNDWEGSGTGDALTEDSDVEPGRVIQVSVYYVPGTDTEIAMQIGLKYDSTLVEPMYYEGELYVETDMSTTYQGGIWPAAGTSPALKKQTNWQVLYNDYVEGSQINFIVQDSTNSKPLETEGIIATVYFKIKDDASAGSVINFSYDSEYTTINQSRPVTTSGLNLNVFGEMSENVTLNTLSVTSDGTTYSLSPEFVPDSLSVTEYTVIVPNQVESIEVAATATDEYASVASGTGTQNLAVGNNDINIIVQAQDGTQETYVLHVYRLSNDATLKSLSLSNDINIGTFASGTTAYTALVPYSTSSTEVTAEKNYEKATIKSGTGTWNLSEYGSTINSRSIVVQAENCNATYASVPNNTCNEKTYTIDITRTAPSTNANLSYLTVDGVSVPDFSPTTYEYTLDDVSNATTSINVNALVEDTGKATITSTLGNKTLQVGDNTITIVVQAEDNSTKEYKINVRRLSNDSSLSSLTVTSDPIGQLSPTFSSSFYDYYTYSAPSTVSTVTIAATVNDTTATIVSGPGSYNIDNTPSVDVVVQAEDGTTSTYIVKLVRSKSTNANLSSLSIDGYSLNETFSPATTLYTANVSGEVTKVTVNATVEDTGKATIVSGTGEHELEIGNNTIQVRVQAENGSTKDYTITVNRAKKTISALSDLKVDGTTVAGFDEETLEYDLGTVAFEKTSIEIEATLKDADSTVEGTGTINLSTGENTLYVTVTAQDGVTKTSYILKIEREKDDNAYLSDIKVDGVTIENFVKTTNEYDLDVSNETTSLNLAVTTESTLASYEITGNENFVTTAKNPVKITVTSESGSINIYTINVVRAKSDNNYLKSITLSSGLLNPTFDKETNSYTVDVDRSITSMTITAEVEEPNANYAVTGPSSLEIGENTFKITVTSESGIENVYTIVVKRNPSNNNYLSDLKVDGVTITGFIKTKELYTINAESTKENVTISATTEEIHATTSGTGTFDLETGVNTFPIVVTAENGDERTYSIVVNKAKSDNSYLSSLSVAQSTISPTFESGIFNYTSSVAYSITNVDILATPSDTKSTVVGTGNKELQTGPNTFEIVVTSENNTTSTYTLVITRAKNDNANLSNIVLSGGFSLTPNFDSAITEYSVHVPNSAENIQITAYKQDPNAVSVTGTGTVSLNTGLNTIELVVTAEDGVTKKTYTINIERDKSSDATLKTLDVSSGTLNPTFNSATTEYELIVQNEIESVSVTATTTSSAASYVIAGNTDLSVGTNPCTITVTAEDGTTNIYTINILRQPSSNNFLQSLSVKDAANTEYIETFLKTKLEYNITVENAVDKINILGVVDDTTSSIVGNGEQTLDIGSNTFNVIVTSAAGIERTYEINIFRKANSNNYLTKLEVENYTITPTFEKNTLSYTLNVDSLVSNINIIAEAEVSTSIVTGTGSKELQTGVNNFDITVQAEDGSIKTYVIVVNKAASNNNYLSNLTVSTGDLTPEFNRETLEYSVHVSNETETMSIDATPEHASATITGTGLKSLSVGTHKIEIVVKAENNETRTYSINVTRDASSNKDLSDLKVNGETIPGFNKDVLEYELDVENSVTSITIQGVASDETATVAGDGVINLTTGENEIPVTVTAEDGTVKTYTIKVTRAKNSNNYLKSLSVAEGQISPEFNKETLDYNIVVPYEVTSLDIDAEPEVTTSQIEIDSNSNFVVGSNKVFVNVVAETGDVRTYTVNVTRQQQANNFLTSMVITDDDGVEYTLSPAFNKTTYNYEVELPGTVTDVNIAVTKEALSLTVTGDGDVPITSLPQTQKVVVKTTGGLERTYTIKFVKGLSSNANLNSISVSTGVLSPAFDKDEYAYNVDLPAGTTSITISAEKAEEGQVVTGTGTMSLTPGRNTAKVTVTSENGNVRTYTIFVNVDKDSTAENKLSSLTVDKGTLSPAFNPDTKLYNVDLDETQTDITISATGNNTVSGTGTHSLVDGANVFEVVSTDSDGNKNVYRVVVNKGSVVSPYLKYLAIDNYEIEETFNKELYTYNANINTAVNALDVVAVPEDKNATVTITGNNNLKIGNNTISITVTDEQSNTKTYTINVVIGRNKIESDIHTVEESYIQTIAESKTAKEIKDEMLNPNEQLKIYNLSNVEISDTNIVATGYKIKLIINGTEYDSKTLIIKGDLNSDGEVGVADIIKLRLHILETTQLDTNGLLAADTNSDSDVGVADIIKIRNHILGNISLFAKEGE